MTMATTLRTPQIRIFDEQNVRPTTTKFESVWRTVNTRCLNLVSFLIRPCRFQLLDWSFWIRNALKQICDVTIKANFHFGVTSSFCHCARSLIR